MRNFGLQVEIDVPERRTIGLKDDGDFTLFLEEVAGDFAPSCKLSLEVDDVEATYRYLSAQGVKFEKRPQKLYWGYGAELRDPDGYLIHVWDERSMREKSS